MKYLLRHLAVVVACVVASAVFAAPDKKITLNDVAAVKLELLQCKSQLLQAQISTSASKLIEDAMKEQGLNPAKYQFKDGAFVPKE